MLLPFKIVIFHEKHNGKTMNYAKSEYLKEYLISVFPAIELFYTS
jgi:hypothetical protein